MISNLTKLKKDGRGFTIVELLVVIVVIAILAAITIVSYNGITARAKTSRAQSNANSLQTVAEVMNANNGYYPRLLTDLTTGTSTTKLPTGITIVNTAAGNSLSATTGETTVTYQYCGDAAAPGATEVKGGRIQYWNYSTGAVSSYIYFGTGSASGGAGSAPCHTYVTPAS